MKRLFKTLLPLAVLFMSSNTFSAVERPDFDEGTQKIGINASINSQTFESDGDFGFKSESNRITIGTNVSYVKRGFEWGYNGYLSGSDGDDGGETAFMSFGLLLNYNFIGGGSNTFIPYLGGSINLTTNSSENSDSSGYGVEMHLGANIFASETISLFVELYSQTNEMTSDDTDSEFTIEDAGLRVGFNFWR